MRPTCWLLTRFGVDESLVGDLIERRRAGASFVWFAAQCVVAVTWATTRAVRSHPLRAVATILVGLLLRQLTIRLWAPQEPTLDMDIAGGLLSVFSMNQPTLIIAVSMINDAILAPFWFGIGWLVERSCRGASLLFTLIALAVLPISLVRSDTPSALLLALACRSSPCLLFRRRRSSSALLLARCSREDGAVRSADRAARLLAAFGVRESLIGDLVGLHFCTRFRRRLHPTRINSEKLTRHSPERQRRRETTVVQRAHPMVSPFVAGSTSRFSFGSSMATCACRRVAMAL